MKFAAALSLMFVTFATASTIDLRQNGYGAEGNYWANGTRTVFSFCMDVLQHNSSRFSTYNVILPQDSPRPFGPMGDQKAENLGELWERFFDTAEVCVWKTINEDLPTAQQPDDILSGKFAAVSGSVDAQLANDWLRALEGTGPKADLRYLTSSTNRISCWRCRNRR